ncbi:hypothetical protein [Siccirubricoccus phaeus]|uniref:hypothetical protein n=1 Tax=Siccirubricoccus phaeus TaxID=2595053 RepID=UPI0011F1469D|nr:hypothetical protein [Siccirubricoccus phaeus]
MFSKLILASALALSTFGAAQAAGPRLVGGGENGQVVYDAPSMNLAGGGVAAVTGGGADLTYTHDATSGAQRPAGAAMLIGGGKDAQVVRG